MSPELESIRSSLQLADALGSQGRLDEMETICRTVLAEFPQCADAWNKLALAAASRGNGLQAVAHMERAISIAPADPVLHANLGELWRRAGVVDRAVTLCQRAVELGPDNLIARTNLGFALLDAGQPGAALEQFTFVDSRTPGNPQILSGKSRAHNGLGQIRDAAAAATRVVELVPDSFEAWLIHAKTHFGLGDYATAETSARRTLGLQPNLPAALTTLADSLMKSGRNADAESVLRTALQTLPSSSDFLYRLSLCCLARGEYREGFALYETRLNFETNNRIHFPVLPMPMWTDQPIAGKRVLVLTEQGYGDHFQFCRFIPRLTAAGAIPIIGASHPLSDLMAAMPGGAGVLTDVADARSSGCDYWIFVGSLPHRFGVDATTVGMDAPYLVASEAKRALWRERLAAYTGTKRIGLVWAGRPDNVVDAERSLQRDMLAPLAGVPGITWIAMQESSRAQEADAIGGTLPIVNMSQHISSFDDTAALMAELDLVITVDSAPAHLAGALGRPVWVLLPKIGDWRWELDDEKTPWYPTARLFRQRAQGEWGEVMERVVEALETFTRE